MNRKILVLLGALLTGMFLVSPVSVLADEVAADTGYDRYIAFGQDLKASEKQKVLDAWGLSEDDLDDYKVIEITNQEEHDYLGDYIDSSVIGTRALSSVKVVKTEEGSGIQVETTNINYCTSGMYCNALLTAGLEDASVEVAGPFSISGTSALVGAMKAYAAMTGEEISESTMDAATDELVTTAELADKIGDSEKVEELVAAVKQKVFEDQLSSSADIKEAIESSANALGVDLSEEDISNIADMMEKVSKVDVDVNAIKEQASDIYNKLKESGIDLGQVDTQGLSEKVGSFFSNIFNAIKDFFAGLF
jgi:uncharacterized protein YpuA (DUF1002 family)